MGVGYSYVADDGLLVTTDWQAAADMMTLLKALVEEVPTLRSSPLFLVGESYGGKYAATLGVSVARAINAAEINLTLRGIQILDHSVDQSTSNEQSKNFLPPVPLCCVLFSVSSYLFCDRRRPRRQLDLAGGFHCEGTLPRTKRKEFQICVTDQFCRCFISSLVCFLG